MMRRNLFPRSSRPHRKLRRVSYGQAAKTTGNQTGCSLPLSARNCGTSPLADRLTMKKKREDFSVWAAEVTAVTASPMGAPESQRLFGVRRSNGMSELCCLRRGEGYGVCDDEEPSESPRHFAASMDESVIVGYYTLKKCVPRSPQPSQIFPERSMAYGKK